MALTITGIGADGRIAPKGTNVRVPNASAGIGDLVYKSGSFFRVYARGTANAATIDGYTLYGAIYGFVNGMAMIVAPSETSAAWKSSGSCSIGPEFGANTVLMRNGQKTSYYAQMNTAMNASYITGGSAQNEPLASAYQATSLANPSAWNSTYVTNPDILKKYPSWSDYIRQTLRVNGAPRTPFGAVTSGVKVHQFGRWMTHALQADSASAYPAANYCYTYGEGNGTWWLPSMFELGELMIDEHLDKVKENSLTGWTGVSNSSARWSCVRNSASSAWLYLNLGMSGLYVFTGTLTVRPVTLLKL